MDTLANELLELIASHLESIPDLGALALVNRTLHSVFEPALYRRALRSKWFGPLLRWTASRDSGALATTVAKKMLAAGLGSDVPPDEEEDGPQGYVQKHPPGRDIETALAVAVLDGNDALVELLLSAGARTEFGSRVIHFDHGNYETCGDLFNCTPLTSAAYKGSPSITSLLLQAGAQVNSGKIRYRGSAIWVAADLFHFSVIEVLLEAIMGSEEEEEEEDKSILESSRAGVSHEYEARVPEKRDSNNVDDPDGSGRTLLFYAAAAGCFAIVQRLLRSWRSDINVRDIEGRTPLFVAAQSGHESIARILLQHGANVNADPDPDAEPSPLLRPILAAASGGHGNLVRLLVSSGARVNVENTDCSWGRTPLFYSAAHGHLDTVELLLAHGADAYCPTFAATPLSIAAANGHLAVVEVLLAKEGAAVDGNNKVGGADTPPLSKAAKNGHLAVVETLIRHGADVDGGVGSTTTTTGRTGPTSTPLSYAARSGHLAVVETLLARGADINRTSGRNYLSPLSEAAKKGHLAVVETLIRHGALVDVAEESLGLPICRAASKGHLAIVELLLESGADVNGSLPMPPRPLYLAAAQGHGPVVELLLRRGADVRVADVYGDDKEPLLCHGLRAGLAVAELLLKHDAIVNPVMPTRGHKTTPLHVAASLPASSDKEALANIVRAMMERGADVNVEDAWGHTPLHLAVSGGHDHLVEILVRGGADINAMNPSRQTPLHEAAWPASSPAESGTAAVDTVKALLSQGADANARDMSDDTPLHLAARNKNAAVVTTLIAHGVDIYAPNMRHLTPICAAVEAGHVDVVDAFLAGRQLASVDAERNTRVGHAEGHKSTLLELAALWGRADVAELLIRRGADNLSKALHTAAYQAGDAIRVAFTEHQSFRSRYPALFRAFKDRGVNVAARDRNGKPLPIVAALQQERGWRTDPKGEECLETVEVLVAYGADLDARNNAGRTPLFDALEGFGFPAGLLEAIDSWRGASWTEGGEATAMGREEAGPRRNSTSGSVSSVDIFA